MMLRPILLAIVVTFATKAAATSVEDVRRLLHSGDIDALEATVSAMAEAKDQPTIDTYREVSDTLFRTSHPVVLDTLKAWLEQEPRSSAALAANTWAAINEHFLKSSPYGFEFQQPRQREYVPRWEESRDAAIKMGQRAYKAGRKNVTAIDAWLFTQRFKRDKGDVARAATTLLNLSPDRASVQNIVGALVVNTQHPGRSAGEGCWTYGDRAKDYDKDLCLIEAAIGHSVEQDLRDEAERQLANTDDPRLDWARLEVAIWTDPLPDLETLRQFQLSTLVRRYDPLIFDRYAQRIAHMTGNPDYLVEMRDEHLEHLDVWLVDDPRNPRFQRHKSGILMERGDLDEARQSFLDGLHYGWADLNMWIAGAWVAMERFDLADLAVHIENGAATAGNTTGLLQVHQMLEVALSNENMPAPTEEVQCLRLRMARLMNGLCQAYGMQVGSVCRPDHPMAQSLKTTIDITEKSCPAVANTPVSELTFSPMAPRDTAARLTGSASP